jgi:3-oxoacyl-[acyl-carrier-protein] synthase-3
VKSYISKISTYLPKSVLTNEDLANEFPEWSVDKIFAKTGISSRHIADESETCSNMAVSACEQLFESGKIERSDIDFLLLCTQSPDYLLPTTACLVQSKLGLPTTCGALDFNLGCSGYVYGLSLAKGLIESGQAKNVILVTSELYSKYINPKDKSVRTLFGDGATATLLQSTFDNSTNFIGEFEVGSDGRGGENLIVPHGGSNFPIDETSYIEDTDESGNVRTPSNLYMNGSEIFTFTLISVPKCVKKLLIKSGYDISEIDYVVFHQANKFMLEKLRKKLKFTEEQFLTSFETYGNTVSSTIPLGLAKANAENQFNSGDKILLIGFGVGYSWAGTIITWY